MSEWKIKTYEIISDGAMLTHNGNMADPLNPIAIKLKEVTSKRKKTEADYLEMARLEFIGGLYTNDKGEIILPADVWMGFIKKAAQMEKMGKAAQAGVLITKDMLLDYGKKRTPDELFKDPSFIHRKKAKVGTNSVMRTRPMFKKWSGTIEVMYDPKIINEKELTRWFQNGGAMVGVGDWRPIYGKFTIEEN